MIFLAGCSAGPSTPYNEYQAQGDSQFFVHPSTYMPEINAIAMRYCAGRGKAAIVQHQAPYGANGLRQTNYLCR